MAHDVYFWEDLIEAYEKWIKQVDISKHGISMKILYIKESKTCNSLKSIKILRNI